jgi:hypothetical protein
MTDSDFIQTFEEFLGRNGWPSEQSAWSVVGRWESLVKKASAGYHWGYYEFTNELGVRDLLERAFNEDTLKDSDQVAAMRERVGQADAGLRELFLPNIEIGRSEQPWWRRGVLARAGDEYAEDISRLYGIDILH